MKVLHLISGGDTGGAKTHVITLLKKLISLGVDVQVLCVMDGVFTKEALKNRIPVKIIEQSRRTSFKKILEIKSYIKKEKFDLVHCHGARANYIAFFIKNSLNIPFLTTLHSDYKLDFSDNIYKKLIFTPINYICLKSFSHILTVTENFKKMLISRGFKESSLITIYNGLDFDKKLNLSSKSEFLKSFGINFEEDKVYIGLLARLQSVKGIKYFLQAINCLIKSDNEDKVRVLIAGSGSLKKYAENFILNNNLQNKVKMLGFINNTDSFFNVIDINVLSSLSESFPYSLLEGARLKKATVSTNVGGICEMITDGKHGFLTPPKDFEKMAQKINFLVKNPSLRKDFGEEFYKFTCNNFSDTKMANVHIDIYKNIISYKGEN